MKPLKLHLYDMAELLFYSGIERVNFHRHSRRLCLPSDGEHLCSRDNYIYIHRYIYVYIWRLSLCLRCDCVATCGRAGGTQAGVREHAVDHSNATPT